jgi:hypothetical protein
MFSKAIHWVFEQWRSIDREHRTESLPSGRAAIVLITVAISLTLARYFGGRRYVTRTPVLAGALADLPYGDLPHWLYWAGFKIINYVLLPVLIIKFVLKRRVLDHGLRFVKEPRVWLLYAAMLAVVLPLAYVASTTGSFLNTYPKYRSAGESWTQLIVWEVAYGLQFAMLEFFFRGFALFALARYIGALAIFAMVVPYAMIHFDKPITECLGSIIAGTALGTVALRTGTIYGGVVVHCAVAWSMDLFALSHTGDLNRLLSR